jgi:hypothetical protein
MTRLTLPGRRDPGSGPGPNGRIALGLLLIGTGRPSGFAQFGASADAFLASLAPLVGLLIVLACLLALSGHAVMGVSFFVTALCDLLAPVVIADLFCRLWQRRRHWALYANVLNCAQWLMLAALTVLLPLAGLCVALGVDASDAALLMIFVFGLYAMWFHWFTARHVLEISRGRALLVMLAVVFGTGVLLQVPMALAGRSSLDAFGIVAPDPAAPAADAPTTQL